MFILLILLQNNRTYNRVLTTTLGNHTFIHAKALGPILPKVCQYQPLAYHSHVITYKYKIVSLNGK